MIRVGLVVEGKIGVAWYGSEITPARKDELVETYGSVERIQPVEFGVNFYEGVLLADPVHPRSDELSIRYYLPDEESPQALGEDRRVNLSEAGMVIRERRRQKCDPGYLFLGGGDYVEGYREIIHFETGFLPPFRSRDVLLLVDDLKDLGYNGYILADVWYMGKERSFSEADLFYDRRLASCIIDDGTA